MPPIRNENSSENTQLRLLKKEKKKLSKQLKRTKQRLEKDKAKVEEIEIELAEWGKLVELDKMENAYTEYCIFLTHDIISAEDDGDFARAELLKHSGSVLLAKMEEEIQAFKNAGGNRE
ncbi:hypothetical protein SLEP1_g34161 [Rubroshorea leprosula]|uniref:Uncharacterized protein n=1 Tax=Rubroshorea leprosula TaxID=152421 RepID=A0AAV5KJ45_9ROSI|nr:hypothetical protein SLEP1_g34161 [Rubroshorea leprosula]